MAVAVDQEVAQLKSWLDQYLTTYRAVYNVLPTKDIILFFIVKAPDLITVHCSSANPRTLPIKDGEYYYGGPATVSSGLDPQLFKMVSGQLVLVQKYIDTFGGRLTSLNPTYDTSLGTWDSTPHLVVDVSYAKKSGDTLTGPLLYQHGTDFANENALVPRRFVEQMFAKLERRINILENKQ